MLLENFIFSVNAVAPMFIVMAVGYVLRIRGLTDVETNRKMNKVIFNVGIPLLLFRDVSATNLSEFFDGLFLLFVVTATTIVFIVTMFVSMRYFKNRKIAATFAQACYRGNFAIIGLPLTAHVLGPDNMGLGLLIMAFILPLYNVLAAIAFAGGEGQKLSGMAGFVALIRNIFNPLTIGILSGVIFSLLRIQMPVLVSVPIDHIASMTTPLALLIIGGNIDYSRIRMCLVPALWVTAIKLLIGPIIFVPIALLIGFRADAIVVIYLMLAVPTAIVSYVVSSQMGGDEDLALNSILLTMTFGLFTLTLGLFILRSFGLI